MSRSIILGRLARSRVRWEYTRLDQLALTWLIALLNWLFSFDSDRIGEHQADADGNDMIDNNVVGPSGAHQYQVVQRGGQGSEVQHDWGKSEIRKI